MNPDDRIHLAFSADGTYLRHLAALLHSLLESNPGERFAFYLLQGPDLNLEDSRLLEAWLAERGHPLQRLPVTEESLRGFRPSQYFHRSIWYRVLLPQLLPQLPKILYLDADTLVLDRIRPLWETELAGQLFGAVVNPLYPSMPNWPVQLLGLPHVSRYLNSGVLLADLEGMRREAFVLAVRRYSMAHPECSCAGTEQDTLAALYHERCLFLHPRWNAQTTFYELRLDQLPVAPEQALEARRNPAIVHFIGTFKPSHYLCRHPYRERYLRHRQNTPWPLTQPEGRTLANFLIRRLPPVWSVRVFNRRRALMKWLGLATTP